MDANQGTRAGAICGTLRLPKNELGPLMGAMSCSLLMGMAGLFRLCVSGFACANNQGPTARGERTSTSCSRFFAYLLSHGYAWNTGPEQIRSYVKAFLLDDLSCEVSPDTTLDGYRLTLTRNSPLPASSLRALLAAIRDFHAVMAEAGLYAYANPMCSQLLQRWKHERINRCARPHLMSALRDWSSPGSLLWSTGRDS